MRLRFFETNIFQLGVKYCSSCVIEVLVLIFTFFFMYEIKVKNIVFYLSQGTKENFRNSDMFEIAGFEIARKNHVYCT